MLEQIKEELAANYANEELNKEYTSKVGNFYGLSSSFIEGFEGCMNLELPIKFANYLEQLTRTRKEDYYLYKLPTNDYQWFTANELFSHFLNNIYEN